MNIGISLRWLKWQIGDNDILRIQDGQIQSPEYSCCLCEWNAVWEGHVSEINELREIGLSEVKVEGLIYWMRTYLSKRPYFPVSQECSAVKVSKSVSNLTRTT